MAGAALGLVRDLLQAVLHQALPGRGRREGASFEPPGRRPPPPAPPPLPLPPLTGSGLESGPPRRPRRKRSGPGAALSWSRSWRRASRAPGEDEAGGDRGTQARAEARTTSPPGAAAAEAESGAAAIAPPEAEAPRATFPEARRPLPAATAGHDGSRSRAPRPPSLEGGALAAAAPLEVPTPPKIAGRAGRWPKGALPPSRAASGARRSIAGAPREGRAPHGWDASPGRRVLSSLLQAQGHRH